LSENDLRQGMDKITQQDAMRAAMLLNTSIKSVAFYPQAHQAVKQPLEELAALFAETLKEKTETFFGVVEGAFFLEEHIFVTPNAAVGELADRLLGKGIDAVSVFQGVSFEELFHFSSILARKDSSVETLPEKLQEKGIEHIRLGIERYEICEDNGDIDSSRAYADALHAVHGVMKDVARGRIPSGRKIKVVVDNMVSVAMKDHTTLLGLAMIKNYDNYTFNHSVNVGVLALALAAFMGMEQEGLRDVNMAGLLHDIGKTRIEKNILNKPGKLSAVEYELMQKHVETGSEIVSSMEGTNRQIADAVLGHHIRYNRQGYPKWAREKAFGIVTEIVAVADCYDAMTTLRAYNAPITPKEAIDNIGRLAGTHLHGDLARKFVEMMGKYPVGSLVRLDNNEIAVVFRPNPANADAPEVMVALDAAGNVLPEGRREKLVRSDGTCYARIVSTVDPLLKNIDVAGYVVG
jgi:putative nucleotidyltransferase with HDIG domain